MCSTANSRHQRSVLWVDLGSWKSSNFQQELKVVNRSGSPSLVAKFWSLVLPRTNLTILSKKKSFKISPRVSHWVHEIEARHFLPWRQVWFSTLCQLCIHNHLSLRYPILPLLPVYNNPSVSQSFYPPEGNVFKSYLLSSIPEVENLNL